MSDWQTINLNDTIRVKLTPRGRMIWCAYWRPYCSGNDPMDIVDRKTVDGWFEEQMWQIAAIFGPHMENGVDPPIETEVRVHIRGTEPASDRGFGVVHHIDGNPYNNDPANLALMAAPSSRRRT